MNKVYIIVLNWNGWGNTLRCLESLFRLDYPNFVVVVCDNASVDGSFENLKSWAAGDLEILNASSDSLAFLSSPPVSKPIQWEEISDGQASQKGEEGLVLIQTGENRGFAGGVNVGLRYAMDKADMEFVWILNNDTVVRPDALTALSKRLLEAGEVGGICGSAVYYYDEPERIQACGGIRYDKWFGYTSFLRKPDMKRAQVESRIDSVYGASMFVSKQFLEKVGPLSEEFFLYYEEIDWTIRGKAKGFECCYAPESVVYHRGGSSTKASELNPDNKSYVSDYYFLRNRILFTRKFYPFALPTIYVSILFSFLNRLRRRQWDRAWMIMQVFLGKLEHSPQEEVFHQKT